MKRAWHAQFEPIQRGSWDRDKRRSGCLLTFLKLGANFLSSRSTCLSSSFVPLWQSLNTLGDLMRHRSRGGKMQSVDIRTKSSLVTVIALSSLVISAVMFSSALPCDLERLSSCSCARRLSWRRTRLELSCVNEALLDWMNTNRPCASFSSHFFPDPCVLRPPVINLLSWMIVPSSVTAEECA